MSISLRIVGIFYRNDRIDDTAGTVFGVLDAARSDPGATIPECDRFEFSPGDGENITSFSANYRSAIASTVSDREYPPGEYFLSENLSALPAYSVWQYYIRDKDGVDITRQRTRRDNRVGLSNIKPIDQVKVLEDEAVIFRLLQILNGPAASPWRARARAQGRS